jgi:4-hydroxy-4-methyl-2-oxoglutarate aldolase
MMMMMMMISRMGMTGMGGRTGATMAMAMTGRRAFGSSCGWRFAGMRKEEQEEEEEQKKKKKKKEEDGVEDEQMMDEQSEARKNPYYQALVSFGSCVVADSLNRLGIHGQYMPNVRLQNNQEDLRLATMVGRAHTVRMSDGGKLPKGSHIDSASAGDVIVISTEKGSEFANWGGMNTLRASVMGLEGVVLDGCARDVVEMDDLFFPCFSRKLSSQGKVAVETIGEPIVVDGVRVDAGDWVVGDINGVVVVPKDRVDDVIHKAEELQLQEEKVEGDIADGVTITEAFRRHRK